MTFTSENSTVANLKSARQKKKKETEAHAEKQRELDEAFKGIGEAFKGQTEEPTPLLTDNTTTSAGSASVALLDAEIPALDPLLSSILGTRRAHNSKGEIGFLVWLKNYLKKLGYEPSTLQEGALTVEVGTGSKTMFSCHVDTVHGRLESDDKPTQEVSYDPNFGHICLGSKDAGCLGADDGAGIYIMLKMIEAKTPGVYVFHRGEEVGCVSSRAILQAQRKWLMSFNACVAFDRPNNYEVIITQGQQKCASKEYGQQLADALNKFGLEFETSEKGVITDSKIYRQVIPECINLGVGYSAQHSNQEYLDWQHLAKLTDAAIKLDWAALKVHRVINLQEDTYSGQRFSPGQTHPKSSSGYTTPAIGKNGWKSGKKTQPLAGYETDLEDLLDVDFEAMTMAEITELVVDSGVAAGIVRLVCDLQAEKARVKRLQYLLEIT